MTSEERQLRDRIEELEEEVRQLREAMSPATKAPVHLPRTEYHIFCALASKTFVRRQHLMEVLTRGADHLDDESNNLAVHLSRLRKKLTPLGYSIECQRGIGYSMTSPLSPAE